MLKNIFNERDDKFVENLILSFLMNLCASKDAALVLYDSLLRYVLCVERWGAIHNIVSNQFTRADVLENILDSVVGGSLINLEKEVFDAGSGGGFPGIPLAIIYPKVQFNLVESSRKKCSFLRLVRSELGLKNVVIINKRVEELPPKDLVISKAAFSSLNMKILAGLCAPKALMALWLTPKGQDEAVKSARLQGAHLESIHNYDLPNWGARSILVFKRLS